ncbi:MAG: 4Fe-4S dicluster domain-containing protein [Candidatus Margulisiibacteriota bacterium]
MSILDEKFTRKDTLKMMGGVLAATLLPVPLHAAEPNPVDDTISAFLQAHFMELSDSEKKKVVARLKRQYKRQYKKDFEISTKGPIPGVKFSYFLDVSRCVGCRRCVEACVKENNCSRGHNSPIQYIRVLKFKKGEPFSLEEGDHFYDDALVPDEKAFYMPIQCQQCDDSPCTKACPTKATWKEKDGVVVVDYNWCIGCRYCMQACPYQARRFNWSSPKLPAEEINTNTHYLGNRPRPVGVVEKCHFCLQRTREGQYPACHDACPTGVRKFGNILDKESEVRYIFDHYRIFRLKEELNTKPNFYYYTSR